MKSLMYALGPLLFASRSALADGFHGGGDGHMFGYPMMHVGPMGLVLLIGVLLVGVGIGYWLRGRYRGG